MIISFFNPTFVEIRKMDLEIWFLSKLRLRNFSENEISLTE